MKKYSWKNNFKKDAESYWIKEDEVKSFEFTENYNSRAEFYKLAKQKAKRVEEIYGVPWEITFWQSILESWHWESSRAKKQFNFFWHTNNKKDNLSLDNWVNNNFAIYNSIEDWFMAHWKFLRKYSRYNKAFIYTWENKNPWKFLDTIIDAWYVHINQSQYKETIRSILKSRWIII
jgi:flagellum-specific peptidoglycan hydrolase FlgJ